MSVRASSWVWQHSTAKGIERLILLAIADAADNTGANAWPSVETVASMAKVSKRTVQRALLELERTGELIIERNAGGTEDWRQDRRPNRYRLPIDREPPSARGVTTGHPGAESGNATIVVSQATAAGAELDLDGVTTWHPVGDDRGDDAVAPPEPNGVTTEVERGDTARHDGVTDSVERGDTVVTQPIQDPPRNVQELAPAAAVAVELVPAGTARSRQGDEVGLAPSTDADGKPGRPRDLIWDAVLGVCGIDPDAPITPSARGAYNRVHANLRSVGATPETIAARALEFLKRWPGASLTPTALDRRWAELDPGVRRPQISPNRAVILEAAAAAERREAS